MMFSLLLLFRWPAILKTQNHIKSQLSIWNEVFRILGDRSWELFFEQRLDHVFDKDEFVGVVEVAVLAEEFCGVRFLLYRRWCDFDEAGTEHDKLELILREHEARRVSV